MVYLGFFGLWEQQRLQTHPQHPQKVHTRCLALEKAVDEMLNKELIRELKQQRRRRATATAAEASL